MGDILAALLDLGFLPALHQAQKHINGKLGLLYQQGSCSFYGDFPEKHELLLKCLNYSLITGDNTEAKP